MSESMPERTGGGNIWSRKYGPLPLWGWGGIVVLLAIVYSLYKKHTTAASSAANAQSNPSVNSPGGVDASLVPQFVNQVYTQGTPPAAPSVTVNNQIPTSGGGGTPVTPPPNQPPASVHQYPQPQGLSVSKVNGTTAKVSWTNIASPQPAPKSYTIAVYQGGKTVAQQTVSAPDTVGGKSTATIPGLPQNGKNLQVHVWANGGAIAPPHAAGTVNL